MVGKKKDKKDDYVIKDSGQRTEFETGAVRDLRSGKGRFDLVPPAPIRALAIHFEKGAIKYGPRNWEKGIPLSKFLDSAERHLQQIKEGMNDENHPISVLWNIVCYYETLLRIQNGELPDTLDDMPKKIVLPNPYGKPEKKSEKSQ